MHKTEGNVTTMPAPNFIPLEVNQLMILLLFYCFLFWPASKLDELMLDCFIEGGDHWPAEMFTKNQTPASSLQLLQQVTILQWYSSDESLHCLEPRGREIIVVQEVGVNHLSITQWKVSILCLPGLILTILTAKES